VCAGRALRKTACIPIVIATDSLVEDADAKAFVHAFIKLIALNVDVPLTEENAQSYFDYRSEGFDAA